MFWLQAVSTLLVGGAHANPDPVITGLGVSDAYGARYREEFHLAGEITLRDGLFEEPAVEGSAALLRVRLLLAAVGDLNGDGADDLAVVLVTRPGGSGAFVSLHALVAHPDGALDVDRVFLGDRIHAQRVRIDNGCVRMSWLDREEEAPMAQKPDKPVRRVYVLEDGKRLRALKGCERTPSGRT